MVRNARFCSTAKTGIGLPGGRCKKILFGAASGAKAYSIPSKAGWIARGVGFARVADKRIIGERFLGKVFTGGA